MSDTGWENIIDKMLRRDVEPIPMNFGHLLDAYRDVLMDHERERTWTSHMEGDIEE